MFCPNCGRETTGKFCPSCGTKLYTEPAAPQPNEAVGTFDPNEAPKPSYDPGASNNPGASRAPDWGAAPNWQSSGVYQGAPAAAIGKPSAIEKLRKLAASPVFLMAVILFTVTGLFSIFTNGVNLADHLEILDAYKHSSLEATLIGNIVGYFVTMMMDLLMIIAVWSIFVNCTRKDRERIGTGGLTFFKVIFIICLVGACLFLVFLLIALGTGRSYLNDLNKLLNQAGYSLSSLQMDVKTLGAIVSGVMLLIVFLLVLFLVKMVKTLNTAKRVIKTGAPDDRVSVFVGVILILAAVGGVINGIRVFAELRELGLSQTVAILYGVNYIVNALSILLFAVVLFQFRSAMRSLGVRKGVRQYQ
ncbi:MAG: zinc ribbon domain-containing protein [Oscillospiraceae bacterium]|nr:zinc ribbon domain-containing protein [Oscillospiraceae bacterium]